MPFEFLADPEREVQMRDGYWFRTDGSLVPIPEDMYAEKYRGPAAKVLVSLRDGRDIGSVEWLPWADGHVILFSGWAGSVPMEILRAFTEPYGKVSMQSFRPDETATDVKPGPRPEHFEKACTELMAGASPFVIKKLI